jgi:hypothetical protein
VAYEKLPCRRSSETSRKPSSFSLSILALALLRKLELFVELSWLETSATSKMAPCASYQEILFLPESTTILVIKKTLLACDCFCRQLEGFAYKVSS